MIASVSENEVFVPHPSFAREDIYGNKMHWHIRGKITVSRHESKAPSC